MKTITTVDRCKICLEEECGGHHKCNCKNCVHLSECTKILHATIRITNRCTQKCSHCCFSSHPDSKVMMTIGMSEKIAKFLKNNEVISVNLMGGEFFCNKKWFRIVINILHSVQYMRIVSNGDWVYSKDTKEQLLTLNSMFHNKFRVSISKDRYHTNSNVESAINWLNSNNINCDIAEEGNQYEDYLVPIGRSQFHYGTYSSFSCYCHNPKKKYAFLIDEKGNIYKCGFGVWQYATVEEYINGDFAKRFKEFNKKFYSIFVSSCASCIRVAGQEKDNIVSHD